MRDFETPKRVKARTSIAYFITIVAMLLMLTQAKLTQIVNVNGIIIAETGIKKHRGIGPVHSGKYYLCFKVPSNSIQTSLSLGIDASGIIQINECNLPFKGTLFVIKRELNVMKVVLKVNAERTNMNVDNLDECMSECHISVEFEGQPIIKILWN